MLDCDERPREWPGRAVLPDSDEAEGAEEVADMMDEIERVLPCLLVVEARMRVFDGEDGVDLLAMGAVRPLVLGKLKPLTAVISPREVSIEASACFAAVESPTMLLMVV